MSWLKRTCSLRLSYFEPHLGERTIDEVAQGLEAAAEKHARAPPDSDRPVLQDLEGEDRISNRFSSCAAKPRRSIRWSASKGPFAAVDDRLRDGLVEAPVESLELIRRDRASPLDGQLGDRLAHVSVVVNDLGEAEPRLSQLGAVLDGTLGNVLADGAVRRLLLAAQLSPPSCSERAVRRAPFSSGVGRGGRAGSPPSGESDDNLWWLHWVRIGEACLQVKESVGDDAHTGGYRRFSPGCCLVWTLPPPGWGPARPQRAAGLRNLNREARP